MSLLVLRTVCPKTDAIRSKRMPATEMSAICAFDGSTNSHLVWERAKGHSTLTLIPVILPPNNSTKEAWPISWMTSLAIFMTNPRKRNISRNLAYSLRPATDLFVIQIPLLASVI